MAGHQWCTKETHQLHELKSFFVLQETVSRVYCNKVLHVHCLLQISKGSCKNQADGDGEGAVPRIDEADSVIIFVRSMWCPL
jgi:hypothetical protein